jgi:hypothetical protein
MLATKQTNHAQLQTAMRRKSVPQLRYIIRDCRETLRCWPDHPNEGHYLDEIHYAAMELARREEGGAR